MKNVIQFIYFIVIFLNLTSCRSVIDEVELDNEAKYTVACFLSPQDTISLYLGLSSPLNQVVDNEANRQKIKQAKVTITNEKGEKIKLEYNTKEKQFKAPNQSFLIENGKRYDLKINTIDGKIVSSYCVIPSTTPDFNIVVDSVNGLFYLKYQWQDKPNEINHYRYYGWKRNTLFSNQSHEILWSDGSQIATQVIADDRTQGALMTSNRADTQKTPNGFISTWFNTYVDAALLNVDKNYYEFQRSIEKSETGNNFEPTPTFSNIEGGLGIFAGCDIKRKTFKIR